MDILPDDLKFIRECLRNIPYNLRNDTMLNYEQIYNASSKMDANLYLLELSNDHTTRS